MRDILPAPAAGPAFAALPALVVDASVGAKTLILEEMSDLALALLERAGGAEGPDLLVPDLFFAECANALRKGLERYGLDGEIGAASLETLCASGFTSTPVRGLVREGLALARAEGLSVYDACYVALSDRTGAPLVTADRRLHARMRGTRHRAIGLWETAA